MLGRSRHGLRVSTWRHGAMFCALTSLLLLPAPVLTDVTQGDVDSFADTHQGQTTLALLHSILLRDPLARYELGNRLAAGSGGVPANVSAALEQFSIAASSLGPVGPSLDVLPTYPIRHSREAFSPSPVRTLDVVTSGEPLLASTARAFSTSLNDGSAPVLVAWLSSSGDNASGTTASFAFDTPGQHTVRALVIDSGGRLLTQTATVLVMPENAPPAPIPLSPAAGADLENETPIDFTWQQEPTAETYDFRIVDLSSPEESLYPLNDLTVDTVCISSQCSVSITLNIPVQSGYAWQVLARTATSASDWSSTRFNLVQSITEAPEEPTLISPVSGAVVESGTMVPFVWEPSLTATSYEVDLPGNTASTTMHSASACSPTECSALIELDVPVGIDSNWTVTAINSIGATESNAAVFFAIEAATAIPAKPDLLSPVVDAELLVNETATFTWDHDDQVATYDFYLFNNAPGENHGEMTLFEGLSPRDICSNGLCEIQTAINLPVFDNHLWSVRAGNSSGQSDTSERIFNTVEPHSEPPTSPVTLSPVSQALFEQDSDVEFRWSTSETADLYKWELNDTQNSEASTPGAYVPANACVADSCSVEIALDVPVGDSYEWRVRAENDAGESAWSTSAIEIIAKATDVPTVPTPLNPDAGALVSQNDTIDFEWTRDPHSITYEFSFFDVVNSIDVPVSVDLQARDICTDQTCIASLTVDLPIGEDHVWLVRGRNALGASDWSRDTFTVVEPVTDVPGSFELTQPAEDSEIQENTEVMFVWTRADQATHFELSFVNGIDPDAAMDVRTVNASSCSTDSCSYLETPTLPVSDQHSWQVRAINSHGATEWISAPLNIVAESVEPAPALVVIAPLASTPVLADQPQSFLWEQDIEALSYEFYISDADNGPQPVVADLLAESLCESEICSYTQTVSLLPGTQHSWHVRARYPDTESQWTDTLLTVVSETVEPDVYVLADTNVSGGGFQGDVTISDDGLVVYSSADNSGVLKSTNGGRRFESHNEGLQSNKVASLAITPDNSQILYAGTGDKGTTGGLFRSIDGGDTWSITGEGANARFAGNHTRNSDPLPNGHPRSNGDLIVVDPGDDPTTFTDDVIIAGSYQDGVHLFTQGGESEAFAVNTSGFVRSVAANQTLPDTAFAAIQFADETRNGIYKIDYSDLSNPVSSLEYPVLRPEGLTVLANGHVYAAIGDEGIVKFDGTTWTLQNSGLDTGNPNRVWTAVKGYVSASDDVVYAGTNNRGGFANGVRYPNIWRTTDGGVAWSPLVDAQINVDDTIYGKDHDWWFRVDAFPEAGLGRRNSIVSSIDIALGESAELVTDDIIYVSGRGGIWKSENGGDSWQPTVNNMQVTSNHGVAVNPNNPTQVVLANTDYVVLETRSGFEGSDVARDKPEGAESRAYDVVFDDVANAVVVGAGHRDTNNPGGGEVYIKPTLALGEPAGSGWTNTNIQSATASNNGRVRAVAYGYHDGVQPTSRIILAAVDGEGVFRYHNNTWSKSSGISLDLTHRSRLVWPNNGNAGVVYLLDLSVGLYRSIDGGQSWTDIWPSMTLKNNDFYNTGYIASDVTDPTTLYVSIQGTGGSPIGSGFRVFRMTEADSRIFGEPGTAGLFDISSRSDGTLIERPGPLAVGPDGKLWLTEQQDSKFSIDAGLYVMDNPATDNSFTEITTNDYRNAAITPIDIDVSTDGYLYISQGGGGLVKIGLPCTLDGSC